MKEKKSKFQAISICSMPTSSVALKSVVSLSKNSRNTSLSRSTCGTSDGSTPIDDKSMSLLGTSSISIGISGIGADAVVDGTDDATIISVVCGNAICVDGGDGSCCDATVVIVGAVAIVCSIAGDDVVGGGTIDRSAPVDGNRSLFAIFLFS